MSLVNRVIVTCRIENGDSIDVSVKALGRDYNKDDVQKLGMKMAKLFGQHTDDTLYYQVRSWSGEGGKTRRNWSRLRKADELSDVLKDVMGVAD